jgi:anthranilate 1,2-dioxygenase small subunit
MTSSLSDEASALLAEYGWLIDTSQYDAWLDLFPEDTVYKIIPRENLDAGLPASLIYCRGKNMLRDRITALLKVNKFNIHTTRHFIGRSRVTAPVGELVPVSTPYAVYQTDQEGVSRLFAVGAYESKLVRENGAFRFAEQIVQLDTFSVPPLLSDPL